MKFSLFALLLFAVFRAPGALAQTDPRAVLAIKKASAALQKFKVLSLSAKSETRAAGKTTRLQFRWAWQKDTRYAHQTLDQKSQIIAASLCDARDFFRFEKGKPFEKRPREQIFGPNRASSDFFLAAPTTATLLGFLPLYNGDSLLQDARNARFQKRGDREIVTLELADHGSKKGPITARMTYVFDTQTASMREIRFQSKIIREVVTFSRPTEGWRGSQYATDSALFVWPNWAPRALDARQSK